MNKSYLELIQTPSNTYYTVFKESYSKSYKVHSNKSDME